ncbi:triosephosphate isomerase (TIM) [Nematocida displodere]|uniref:Triosephosphate isomerase n=1 Tax=Nematocida displodere TaxID=1805483 RepID=A0A177EBS8_9MICR|nr:triosephosphate isomerase (TIM) [Nematocida displodere]
MKVCVGNWKMNGSTGLLNEMVEKLNQKRYTRVEVVIAPPFTHLKKASETLDKRYSVCAQSLCGLSEEGSFTGAVGTSLLKDVGVHHVIIGHSERVKHFGEETKTFLQATVTALKNGLAVIYCVGESEVDREEERTMEVIKHTMNALISTLHKEGVWELRGKLTVAYEPLWAIGSGATPTVAEIEAVQLGIKSTLPWDAPVLYGGSVTSANTEELLSVKGLGGFLIGKSSLSDDFFKICDICNGQETVSQGPGP